MTNAVEVRQLRHRYGQRVALDGIDLHIATGEIFGMLGPNGSGKSTLFRILSTLIPPQEGSVSIFGFPLSADRLTDIRRQIGVVFQAPALDKMLSGYENLRHQGHLYGITGAVLKRRIDRCIAAVGMTDDMTRRTDKLSGGQRRRIELAKSLLHEPKLLILDEPCTGLDPAARLEFWAVLKSLRDAGTTILLTTHLLDEAEYCSRLAILDRGKLVAVDSPAALRASVGGQVIAISAENPAAAAARIASSLNVHPTRVDDELRIEIADSSTLLPQLIDLLGEDLRSVSLGKPTLQDVFLRLTGRKFVSDLSQSDPTPPKTRP